MNQNFHIQAWSEKSGRWIGNPLACGPFHHIRNLCD